MTDSSLRSISVAMPVRNAAPFLDQSIGSILNQTFPHFEFVILDDASDDGSADVLERWARKDLRIRLFHSDRPLGITGAANRVVEHSRCPLVARMDGDDVSHPLRLMRQLQVLEDPGILAVGSLYNGIDAAGESVRPRDRWRLLQQSLVPPFAGGSATFRRSVFDELGGYREACTGWEDQDLFLRMAQLGRIAVLPEAFYSYRFHRSSTTMAWDIGRREKVVAFRTACLAALRSGRDYSDLILESSPPPVTRLVAGIARQYETRMRMWSGEPPSRPRMAVNGSARPAPSFWTWWGSAHPSSLRFLIRAFIRVRDFLAGFLIRDGKVYRWRWA